MDKVIAYTCTAVPLVLAYENGVLTTVMNGTDDRVEWDGIKHKIELFEEDIDLTLFKRLSK